MCKDPDSKEISSRLESVYESLEMYETSFHFDFVLNRFVEDMLPTQLALLWFKLLKIQPIY